MEKVPLNNVQLDHLAKADAILKPYFYGTVACDRLPRRPIKKEPRGYIVNTDPHDQPGRHWLALWTHSGNVRGDGQLRLTFGLLHDNRALAGLVKKSLEICDLQRTVSAIDLQ